MGEKFMIRRTLLAAWLGLFALATLTSAPTAMADAETDEEARALYQAGRIAFDQGRFDSALDYFQRSYELSGRPALLFNIGSAADRLRRDAVALDAFERYLEEVPDSPDTASVQARIRVLRAAVAAEEAAPEPPPEEEPGLAEDPYLEGEPVIDYGLEPAPHRSRRKLGWILTSAGAGVAFTGFVLFATGQVKRNDIEGAADGTPFSEVEGSTNANAFTASGAVISLLGFGAIATGVTLLLKGDGEPGGRAVKLSPSFGGLSLSGSF
jgi:tetratricopeptide (TPR) repeat protein